MNVLLLAGAGTSIELGVPGMIGMGGEFVEHSKRWSVEPERVQTLIGGALDIEQLIEALDSLCMARATLSAVGGVSGTLDYADKIRAEVEWFVQHTAERVLAREASLMWGSTLRAASASGELTLVTTNYDRAIELAANAEGLSLDDGFGPFEETETATWRGFGTTTDRTTLVKLHGSTDWYAAAGSGRPVKLRHPMPLFGRATLRLADGTDLGSALVLPSREKLLTHSPYPRLSQMFLNAADRCDFAVFIGSSLRDDHIKDALASTARRVPVFFVNPSPDVTGREGVTLIRQCASTFLIATFPDALNTADPVEALRRAALGASEEKGVLAPLLRALDSDAATDVRCRALEQIDQEGAVLDAVLLRRLLADNDATVARYALGLLSLSRDRLALVQDAAASRHATDGSFKEDLDLLRQMLD